MVELHIRKHHLGRQWLRLLPPAHQFPLWRVSSSKHERHRLHWRGHLQIWIRLRYVGGLKQGQPRLLWLGRSP